MWIKPTIIAAGILSVALIPGMVRGMDEEIIEVHGCAPGWTDVGSFCVMDPVDPPPGGDGGGEDLPGDGGGGVAEPIRLDTWDDATWAEARKQWNCDRCEVEGTRCLKRAQSKETGCITAAREQARYRCDAGNLGGGGTIAPWGCSIDHLRAGTCTTAEAPWNETLRWQYFCSPRSSNPKASLICTGPGITECQSAWAASHAGGSHQVVDTGTFNISYEGVGTSHSRVITATYNLSPLEGYLSACSASGSVLKNGCRDARDACYDHFGCEP